MRVLLLNDTDAFAGTERHILTLAAALDAAGASASIACPAASSLAQRARADGVPVLALPMRGPRDTASVRAIRARLRSGDADIVHAHNGRTALIAAMASLGGGPGACVFTQHFLEPAHRARRGPAAVVYGAAHRWVNRGMQRFIAISGAAREHMLSRGEAPPERIHVVANGIHAPDPATLRDPCEVRRELGVPEHGTLVVCVARLEAEKDVRTLIDAMATVQAQTPRACCVIAGDGSQRQQLQSRIRELTLAECVHLLGFREDILTLVNAADVFALPSVAEPFGLVLLEAMALGRPVVAVGSGGPTEIVEEGQTGLLVPASSPHHMAAAILRLLRDPVAGETMGRRGRARFAERFTAERMARATAEVYTLALRDQRRCASIASPTGA